MAAVPGVQRRNQIETKNGKEVPPAADSSRSGMAAASPACRPSGPARDAVSIASSAACTQVTRFSLHTFHSPSEQGPSTFLRERVRMSADGCASCERHLLREG